MPVVTASDGVRIHYEVEGEGAPLFLIHGFGSGGERWDESRYVEALRGTYRVIAADLRGHGRSDKPHSADAYSPQAFIEDVRLVLDAEQAVGAHVWGYSLGGAVAALFCSAAPERVLSAVLGGWGPRPRPPLAENPTYRALQQGIEAYVDLVGSELTEQARAFYLGNDGAALAALMEALSDWPQAGPRVPCPTLLYAGDADPAHAFAAAFASALPPARFVSLAGAGHAPAFANMDAILPTVRSFLAEVSKAAVG